MDRRKKRIIKEIGDNAQPWYTAGLRFECQRCGRCCRGEPGVVWVNRKEIKEISSFLGITENAFAKSYLRSVNDRFSLLEYGNGDCIIMIMVVRFTMLDSASEVLSVLDIKLRKQV